MSNLFKKGDLLVFNSDVLTQYHIHHVFIILLDSESNASCDIKRVCINWSNDGNNSTKISNSHPIIGIFMANSYKIFNKRCDLRNHHTLCLHLVLDDRFAPSFISLPLVDCSSRSSLACFMWCTNLPGYDYCYTTFLTAICLFKLCPTNMLSHPHQIYCPIPYLLCGVYIFVISPNSSFCLTNS